MEEELDKGYNRSIVTIILCAFNILAYIYSWYAAGDSYISGGMNYDRVVEQKEFYRFLTCMYLHGDISHIAMNMLALAVSGSLVESYLGSLKTAVIYFISGFGGSLLSLLFQGAGENVYSIGASGAVFGLLVAAAIIQNKKSGKSFLRAVVFVLIYAVGTWSQGIDLFGHIGGAVGGAAAAGVLSIHFDEEYIEGKVKTALGIGVTVLISMGAYAYILG